MDSVAVEILFSTLVRTQYPVRVRIWTIYEEALVFRLELLSCFADPTTDPPPPVLDEPERSRRQHSLA